MPHARQARAVEFAEPASLGGTQYEPADFTQHRAGMETELWQGQSGKSTRHPLL